MNQAFSHAAFALFFYKKIIKNFTNNYTFLYIKYLPSLSINQYFYVFFNIVKYCFFYKYKNLK